MRHEAARLAAGDIRSARERRYETEAAKAKAKRYRRRKSSRSPIVGSAEWAETRGDDLGESPDY